MMRELTQVASDQEGMAYRLQGSRAEDGSQVVGHYVISKHLSTN